MILHGTGLQLSVTCFEIQIRRGLEKLHLLRVVEFLNKVESKFATWEFIHGSIGMPFNKENGHAIG